MRSGANQIHFIAVLFNGLQELEPTVILELFKVTPKKDHIMNIGYKILSKMNKTGYSSVSKCGQF